MIKPHIIDYYFQQKCSDADVKLKKVKRYYLLNPIINISANNNRAFVGACGNGQFKVAKWLQSIKPDIKNSADNEDAFRVACGNGYLKIAKWLLFIKPDINIFANNDDCAFERACYWGHLKVAKWLLFIKPDTVISDRACNLACTFEKLKAMKWLLKMKPTIDLSHYYKTDFCGTIKRSLKLKVKRYFLRHYSNKAFHYYSKLRKLHITTIYNKKQRIAKLM